MTSNDSDETQPERPEGSAPSKAALWLRTLRKKAPQLRWLAGGFLIGALVFGLRSWGADGNGAKMGSDEHAQHEAAGEQVTWTCSMHPQIRRDEPGDCPICGMDLIPASSDDSGADEQDDPSKITLSERAQKLAQLRTSPVRRKSDPGGTLRLLGRIEPNESTLKTVTAWTSGRIDKLWVNTTGETVKAGQVIATLYSPEIFAAHQDLITARSQVERLSGGSETARRGSEAALSAARQRLSLLGVPDSELARMAKAKKPITAVPIRTPFGGTVMERHATEGTYVSTGARLYSIAKLDTLWVELDAYESDLSHLSVDQPVRVEVDAYPGEHFDGKITFIEPTLDQRRRTAGVRVEIDNEDGRLRPGMFAQAIVETDRDEEADAPLVIPATAPLFTGRRAVVYVEHESTDQGATYEARTVRLGPKLGGLFPVVAGLSEGERVVTRGAFAVDADLQIRGGNSMMSSPDDTQAGKWDEVADVPRSELRKIAPPIEAYLVVQEALADDDLDRAKEGATQVVAALDTAALEGSPKATKAWETFSSKLRQNASHISQSESIEGAREAFEGLSGTVVMILRVLGNPLERPLHQAHCPMARGSQGGTWIQAEKEVDNSYFGASMLSCGDVVRTVTPGGHLENPSAQSSADDDSSGPSGGHAH